MTPLHIAFAVLCSFIWGLNFVVTKIGLADFPPIFFTCLRYTAIILPLIFFVGRGGLRWSLILKTGLFLGTLTFTLAFIGMALGVPAGLTSLVMQTQVIFTVLLSMVLLKDRPSLQQTTGLAISCAGLALLVWNFGSAGSVVGLLFVLAGAFCSGVTKIIMKNGGNYDTFRLMIWMSIVPPLPLLALSLVFETGQLESLATASVAGYGAILFNAFVSTVLGFGLQGYLIKRYSPNTVAPYALLVPVFGLSTGYLLLGETLGPITLLACALIMAGLAYPRFGPRILASLRPSGAAPRA